MSEITTIVSLPVESHVAFNAWLDSDEHADMIHGTAEIEPEEDGEYSIWDGAISGKTLSIDDQDLIIVQSWRYDYDDWPEDAPSTITLEFLPDRVNPEHTELHFKQVGVPQQHFEEIEDGWEDHYWRPMRKYFKKR